MTMDVDTTMPALSMDTSHAPGSPGGSVQSALEGDTTVTKLDEEELRPNTQRRLGSCTKPEPRNTT